MSTLISFHNIPPDLQHRLIGLLLFRLGGQQTFTPDEIRDINTSLGGITMETSREKITLRCHTPEKYDHIKEYDDE